MSVRRAVVPLPGTRVPQRECQAARKAHDRGTRRERHRQDDVQPRGAKLGDDDDVEHERRECEDQIGDPGQQSSTHPRRYPAAARPCCRRRMKVRWPMARRRERSRAPDDARQDIAAKMIGPEPEHRAAGPPYLAMPSAYRHVGGNGAIQGAAIATRIQNNDAKPEPATCCARSACSHAKRGASKCAAEPDDLGVTHAGRILGLSAR